MQLRLIVACLIALQVVAGYYYDKKSEKRGGKCSPGDADLDETICGTVLPTYCYDNEEWCCETCDKYSTDEPGCEYGDKADWCASFLAGGGTCDAENTQEHCCHSCANELRSAIRRPDPPPACKPGDADLDADHCKTVDPAYCYHASEYCCATCAKHHTGSAGCEYGSLGSWCEAFIGGDKTKCSDKNVKDNCCHECGGARSAKLDFAEKLLRKLLNKSKKLPLDKSLESPTQY